MEAIAKGQIRGAVGVVGCNNPKIKQDYGHVTLTRRLIENDILVVVTGCAAVANGKAGHMMPESADLAGPGLRAVCKALGIPPVLHMGSCVDNVRILVLAGALADFLGVDIDALPLAGAAPEWYSEKALSIGAYVVASGIYTVVGVQPPDLRQPERGQSPGRRAGEGGGRALRRRAGPRKGRRAHPAAHREEAERTAAAASLSPRPSPCRPPPEPGCERTS